MFDIRFLIFLILIIMIDTSQANYSPSFLEKVLWKNRIVISFMPAIESSHSNAQSKNYEKETEQWAERDLLFIEINPDLKVKINGKLTHEVNASELIKTFPSNPDKYLVVLIGKDGSEKHSSLKAIPNSLLFEIIDAMPMRQIEMMKD